MPDLPGHPAEDLQQLKVKCRIEVERKGDTR